MDNNIYYKIEEFDNNNNYENDKKYENDNNNNEENYIHEYEYEYNELPIKNINLICDYYKIKRGKLSKKQKILEIIFFENNMNNKDTFENRKLLWEYVKIIKTDNFLKNYILLDI